MSLSRAGADADRVCTSSVDVVAANFEPRFFGTECERPPVSLTRERPLGGSPDEEPGPLRVRDLTDPARADRFGLDLVMAVNPRR